MTNNKHAERWGLIVLVIVLVLFAMSLCGCSTLKRSQKRLFYVERDNPELLAKYCAEEYPVRVDSFVKETFREGATITKVDTFKVECDSANQVIYVPYVKTISKTDTLYRDRTITKENTAARDTMARVLEKEKESRVSAESKAGTWFKISVGLIIGIVILIALIFLLFRNKVSII